MWSQIRNATTVGASDKRGRRWWRDGGAIGGSQVGWWVVGVAVEVFYGAGGRLMGGSSLGGGPKPVRVSPEYFLNVVGSGKLEAMGR